ncbi:hypothetical protein FF38_13642 [Lucilia cuprina]|uniref:Uncharacterized protein n=1 Tax=Lucilia cuprina TaxID=7375 RepID=A0A0L0C5G2_LUCCU|nr:hypothetical protein FF38_13642 [Lucilia cuprina]
MTASKIHFTNLGFNIHFAPIAVLQMYIAVMAFAMMLGFQDNLLSRITPKYLALSDSGSLTPFRRGSVKESILYFIVNSISSVLLGFTPRPLSILHRLSILSATSSLCDIVFNLRHSLRVFAISGDNQGGFPFFLGMEGLQMTLVSSWKEQGSVLKRSTMYFWDRSSVSN